MGKAKRKKASEFNDKMTKSVFMHGQPNKAKAETLAQIQNNYTNAVNHYIGLIDKEETLFLALVKHDRHASEMRAFEKDNRVDTLSATYSQSAFDMAVDHLYNQVTEIRHELYGILDNVFVKSKVLFAMAVIGSSRKDMVDFLEEMLQPKKKNCAFYKGLLEGLPDGQEFEKITEEVRVLYACVKDGYKLPLVKKARVRVVSTAQRLVAQEILVSAENIQAPYVLYLSDPANKRKKTDSDKDKKDGKKNQEEKGIPKKKINRIEVPLYASRDAIRRLNQYGANATVDFTMSDDGKTLCVAVSFDKKLQKPETDSYVGVDVGISDMLHTSEGDAFGTFHDCETFYRDVVEPSLAGLSDLRNKKHKIHLFLKHHKGTLPEDVKMELRQKMDRIETMIRKAKTPNRKNNHYRNMQQHAIREAVNQYVASLNSKKNICTVLEMLDIKEFNHASRKQNQLLSNFARGMLSKKLMETLNWHGYTFLQVDPAYTSQTCPMCGHVSKESRKGKKFHCMRCGHTDDADHVGSVNIRDRAEDKEIVEAATKYRYNAVLRHKTIKDILQKRHTVWESEHAKCLPAVV